MTSPPPAGGGRPPQPEPDTRERGIGSAVRGFALVAGVAAALGIPHGLLWAVLAPAIPMTKVDGGLVPVSAEPEEFIAGDGWFALLGAVFGVFAGVAAWLLGRRVRGPSAVALLAAGAVAGGLLAGWLGPQISSHGYERVLADTAVGAPLDHPPVLRITDVQWHYGFVPDVRGVPLTEALLAVLVYTLLAGWSRSASLRPDADGYPRPDGVEPTEPLPNGVMAGPASAGTTGGPLAVGGNAGSPLGTTAGPPPVATAAGPSAGGATGTPSSTGATGGPPAVGGNAKPSTEERASSGWSAQPGLLTAPEPPAAGAAGPSRG